MCRVLRRRQGRLGSRCSSSTADLPLLSGQLQGLGVDGTAVTAGVKAIGASLL